MPYYYVVVVVVEVLVVVVEVVDVVVVDVVEVVLVVVVVHAGRTHLLATFGKPATSALALDTISAKANCGQ
jgi:hypothetical protein